MKEAAVKSRIKKSLAAYNDVYWFMPPGAGYGRAGIPDFVGHCAGVFFAIEAKGEGGKTTALQEREMQQIRDRGGFAFVITHKDDIEPCVQNIITAARLRAKFGATK